MVEDYRQQLTKVETEKKRLLEVQILKAQLWRLTRQIDVACQADIASPSVDKSLQAGVDMVTASMQTSKVGTHTLGNYI